MLTYSGHSGILNRDHTTIDIAFMYCVVTSKYCYMTLKMKISK